MTRKSYNHRSDVSPCAGPERRTRGLDPPVKSQSLGFLSNTEKSQSYQASMVFH